MPMHKHSNIERVRKLSMSTFSDGDGLQVKQKFVVYPLSGPGGQLAALQVSKHPQNSPHSFAGTLFLPTLQVLVRTFLRCWSIAAHAV